MWLCWSSNGLVGGSVSLWGSALRFPMSQLTSCCLQDVGLSAIPPVPHLLTRHHDLHHDDNCGSQEMQVHSPCLTAREFWRLTGVTSNSGGGCLALFDVELGAILTAGGQDMQLYFCSFPCSNEVTRGRAVSKVQGTSSPRQQNANDGKSQS